MDFYRDMVSEARKWLNHWGVTEVHTGTVVVDGKIQTIKTPVPQLADDAAGVAFFRILHRFPKSQPRRFESSSRPPPSLTSEEQAGFAALRSEVTVGDSLLPRLSRTWIRGDEDGLLSDWHIFHFHLGTQLESDGFIKRTNHVALAMVEADRFLLIDIRPHGHGSPPPWGEKELLEIVDLNWPDVLRPYQLKNPALKVQGFKARLKVAFNLPE